MWGAWVAQSVKRLTRDFSLGHDLIVVRLSHALGFALDVESAWDSFSVSLCPSPTHKGVPLSLSLKK